MTVEIIAGRISEGVVQLTALDVSEENLQRMERTRDDGVEIEIEFVFDTRDQKAYSYIRKWLRKQKAANGVKTWGEAVQAVVGTITTISQKYRSWE